MSDKQPPPAQSKVLVDLGRTLFGFVSDKAGQPFAISENDPGRLIPFRGRGSVRQALADGYLERLDKVPSSQALTDALQILEGDARRGDRVVPHLRVARIEGRTLVVDRADPTSRPENRYVLLNDYANPGEFEVTGSPDAVFRSTNLTGPLPVPIGDDLARLRDIINVSDADWPLLVGWMVAALIPGPIPILWFGGRQGTGKSTAARTLIQIIDPGPAPLQPAPTDPGEWALVASSRWLIGLDNLSRISPWLSDALCRAVTGDGLAKRQLYSDTDLVVVEVQRPIIITAIDAGAIRGDLAERLVPLELEVIATTKRRTERAIDDWLTAHGPAIVGGLYRLTAQVLNVLPEVQLSQRPRMADFAEILAGCDLVDHDRTGQPGTALDRYLETQGEIFAQVVADDPLGAAIVDLVDRVGRFEGTATELLDALDAARGDKARPRSWPTDAARLGGQMKGLAEALSAVGVDWIGPDRRKKARVHILERRGTGASGASVVPVADPVTGTTNRLQPQGIPDPGASGASNSPSLIYGEEEEGGEEKGGSTTGTTGTSSEIPNNDRGNSGASSPTPHWHLLAPLAPVGKGAVDDLDLPF